MNKDFRYNASIGWRDTWNSYFFSYCEAVDQLYEVIVGEQLVNTLAYPFLYLVRHTLELGFKANIYELSKYSEKEFGLDDENNLKGDHLLPPLQKALKDHFEALTDGVNKPSKMYLEFYEVNAKLEELVKWFHKIDYGSFSFRYPVDRKGNASIPSYETLNLKELKEKYDEAIILLKHTQDVLGDFFTYMDFIRKANSF